MRRDTSIMTAASGSMMCLMVLCNAGIALAIESPVERSQRILEAEDQLATGLDALDREIMGLVNEETLLKRKRAQKLKSVESVDEQVEQAQGRISILNEKLKQRMRARANLRLDERAWRRLIMASERPTEMIRRRGYLRAVLRYDLELLRRLKSDGIVLKALRSERIEAVDAVRELEAVLTGRRDRLEDSRQVKVDVLRKVRREGKLLNRVLKQQKKQRSRLNLGTGDEGAGLTSERGLLPLPLRGGQLVVGFGQQRDPVLKTRTSSSGWTITAPQRTPVRAIHDGRVAFSGWYRGFGNLVILDHGGDHYSLYAHLNSVARVQNDLVKQGAAIGEVGETGSLLGPQLYFELRADRRPVDPAVWLRGEKP